MLQVLQVLQAPAAGPALLLTGSSWPERSEGHERSPAGVHMYVSDHPEGQATVKCVYAYVCTMDIDTKPPPPRFREGGGGVGFKVFFFLPRWHFGLVENFEGSKIAIFLSLMRVSRHTSPTKVVFWGGLTQNPGQRLLFRPKVKLTATFQSTEIPKNGYCFDRKSS